MATTEPPDKGNHTTTTPPGAEPPFGRIWQYHHRDGWREVDDPLPPQSGGLDQQLAEGGFDLFMQHGHDTATLGLSVYTRHRDDLHLIVLTGVLTYRAFLVADGPSLLALLPPLVAMARDAAALDEAERQHEERVKRKRRGLVYNPTKRCMEEAS